jgi:uracil phosphoribosyltransferase
LTSQDGRRTDREPIGRKPGIDGVTVVDHPLVQHKLSLIREKDRSTKSFRDLLKEIGTLLCYEVTRDLPLTLVEIETPMTRMMAPRIAGKKLVFAPILRAGLTFAEGMLDLVPAARVAHIGLYRVAAERGGRRAVSGRVSNGVACSSRVSGVRMFVIAQDMLAR